MRARQPHTPETLKDITFEVISIIVHYLNYRLSSGVFAADFFLCQVDKWSFSVCIYRYETVGESTLQINVCEADDFRHQVIPPGIRTNHSNTVFTLLNSTQIAAPCCGCMQAFPVIPFIFNYVYMSVCVCICAHVKQLPIGSGKRLSDLWSWNCR